MWKIFYRQLPAISKQNPDVLSWKSHRRGEKTKRKQKLMEFFWLAGKGCWQSPDAFPDIFWLVACCVLCIFAVNDRVFRFCKGKAEMLGPVFGILIFSSCMRSGTPGNETDADFSLQGKSRRNFSLCRKGNSFFVLQGFSVQAFSLV